MIPVQPAGNDRKISSDNSLTNSSICGGNICYFIMQRVQKVPHKFYHLKGVTSIYNY